MDLGSRQCLCKPFLSTDNNIYQIKHRNRSSLGKLIEHNRSIKWSANVQVKTGQYRFFLHNCHIDKEMYTFILYVLHRANLGFPFKCLRIGFFIVCIDIENLKQFMLI